MKENSIVFSIFKCFPQLSSAFLVFSLSETLNIIIFNSQLLFPTFKSFSPVFCRSVLLWGKNLKILIFKCFTEISSLSCASHIPYPSSISGLFLNFLHAIATSTSVCKHFEKYSFYVQHQLKTKETSAILYLLAVEKTLCVFLYSGH